jgi:hypothetical protein
VTVRWAGARIAPASSAWTCAQTRLEKSGAKGRSSSIIAGGRVGIGTSSWSSGIEHILLLYRGQMGKVEIRARFKTLMMAWMMPDKEA